MTDGRIIVAALGVLLMTWLTGTAAPQALAPKPHYLGAQADPSAPAVPGVRLSGVTHGSPAEKAGLQVGDIIVKLGAVTITGPDDLIVALKSTVPGRPAEVVYLRDGKEQRTQVSLEPRR